MIGLRWRLALILAGLPFLISSLLLLVLSRPVPVEGRADRVFLMIPLPYTGTIILIVFVIAVILTQIYLNRRIFRPLKKITEGVSHVGDGHLDYRIESKQRDEFDFVTNAFNVMAGQLSALVTTLEATAAARATLLEERNLQLETVSLVGQEVIRQRNVTALLENAVNTISLKFGFFHTAIFTMDDEKNWAVLRAASSEGGLRMLNQGHRLRVGQEGMVGNVAFTGKPRIALDVGDDAVFFRNPDLATTRSEMALPLISDEEIIGVLDVQSEQPAAFSTDDIIVLQLLANQLAAALAYVRVMEVMQSTLEELRYLQADVGRRGWARQVRSGRPSAYEYDRAGTTAVAPIPLPADLATGLVDPAIIMDGETPVVIAALKAGERTLGYLGLSDTNRVWTEDELSLVHSIGEQIALALDNARLFEDTQRNERQQFLISQMLQCASKPDSSPEDILRDIAAILAQGLDLSIVIATMPAVDVPLVVLLAGLDASGQRMEFFKTEAVVDRSFMSTIRTSKELTQLSLRAMVLPDSYPGPYNLDQVVCVPVPGSGPEQRFIALVQDETDLPLDQDTRDLTLNLANQLAVVMDNLELSAETHRRSEELGDLYQSSLRLSEMMEPSEVIPAIAKEGVKLLGAAAGNVWVVDADSSELVLSYDYLSGVDMHIGTHARNDQGLLGRSIAEQQAIAVNDLHSLEDPDLVIVPPEY
ncbi:MAG: GAF domain-containing protein, partial [Anaerolineae bacterium]|nr:GAF domain-containing protein [Anaerolineae bacterium]